MFVRMLIIQSLLLSVLLAPAMVCAEDGAQKTKFITDLSSAKADRKRAEHESKQVIKAKTIELSPLAKAAKDGKLSDLFKLIQGGTDVNAKDGEGKTALHYAAASGQLGAAQVLLENGALVDTPSSKGLTPLLTASRLRDVAMVELFADKGANVNVQDELGSTPLIFAASEGDLVLSRVLLRHGAQIDAKDKDGYTALMFAVLNDDAALVSELASAGANKDLISMSGKRAQDMVKQDGTVESLGIFEIKRESEADDASTEIDEDSGEDNDYTHQRRKLTRLRARRPEGLFTHGSKGLMMRSAHTEVRNVGSVTAENIQVFVVLPGGARVKMTGPSSLMRNAEAIYTADQETQMTREGRLRVEMSCDNCRR